MKKTILFPTDFTIESLHVVKSALLQLKDQETCDIILLHGIHPGDSITELLFYSRSKMLEALHNPEFDEACTVIRNKFASRILSLRKDVFTGITQAAFNQYLDACKADEICIPASYSLRLTSRKSFDLIPFIKKSRITVHEIPGSPKSSAREKGSLAELFLNPLPGS